MTSASMVLGHTRPSKFVAAKQSSAHLVNSSLNSEKKDCVVSSQSLTLQVVNIWK